MSERVIGQEQFQKNVKAVIDGADSYTPEVGYAVREMAPHVLGVIKTITPHAFNYWLYNDLQPKMLG